MQILTKLWRMLLGKANKAIDDNTDPVEQMRLLMADAEAQAQRAKDSQISIKGQILDSENEIEEIKQELSDIEEKRQKLKEYVSSGRELSEDDKRRAERLQAKRNSLNSRLGSKQANLTAISTTYSNLEKQVNKLNLDIETLRDKIEEAESTSTATTALEAFNSAQDIINNTNHADSIEKQIDKINSKNNRAVAATTISSQNSDDFDFDSNNNSVEDFLND